MQGPRQDHLNFNLRVLKIYLVMVGGGGTLWDDETEKKRSMSFSKLKG